MNQSLFQSYQQASQASIDEANALPFAVYHNKEVYAVEVEHIFHHEWVFICAEQQLPKSGDYFAFDLAGEAVAIIRGQDGEIRAMSNNCRHRGTPLLNEGFGHFEKNIVCPYHAWNYDDTGKLQSIPLPGDIQINKRQHCLLQYHLETWMGLLFINLSGEPEPLAHRFGSIEQYFSVFQPQRFIKGYLGDSQFWQANWKLAVENAIETYHLFKVHKKTLETITPSKLSYYVAGSSEWAVTGGEIKDKRSILEKWFSDDYPEAYNHYLLIFLPPSFIGIMTYESFDWIQILPKGPQNCAVQSGGMSEQALSDKDSEELQFVAEFLAEDKKICERVQSGMNSVQGSGGKLVTMEKILVDFRHYLASRLFDSTPDKFIETNEAKLFFNSDEIKD